MRECRTEDHYLRDLIFFKPMNQLVAKVLPFSLDKISPLLYDNEFTPSTVVDYEKTCVRRLVLDIVLLE